MRLWKHRPLFLVCTVFIAVTAVCFFLPGNAKLWGLSLLSAAMLPISLVAVFCSFCRRRCLSWLLLCLVAAVAVGHSYGYFDQQAQRVAGILGENRAIHATVTKQRGSGGHMSTFVLHVSEVDGMPIGEKAIMTCYYASDMQVGHRISLTAEILPLSELALYREMEIGWISDGIAMAVVSESEADYHIMQEQSDAFWVKVSAYRHRLATFMDHLFGEESRGLTSALLLGERDGIPDGVRQDFSRSGVAHLLAISGLHVTLLFGVLERLLWGMHVGRRTRMVVLLFLAVVFLLFLGCPPSATRAVIMLGMVYVSYTCVVRSDAVTALGLAGALILWLSPSAVVDIGFWMSFSAAMGLATLVGLFRRRSMQAAHRSLQAYLEYLKHRKRKKALAMLVAGVIAMTFTMWITAISVGWVSFLSPFLTILLTPVVGVILVGSLLTLLLLPTPLSSLLAEGIGTVCHGMCYLVSEVADGSWQMLFLDGRHMKVTVVAMTVLLLLFLAVRLPRQDLLVLPVVVGWGILLAFHAVGGMGATDQLTVSYLRPSTATEMLVISQGDQAVICDISNGSYTAMQESVRQAEEQGAAEISAMVLTHYHGRSVGSLGRLFEEYKVRQLWLPHAHQKEDHYVMRACRDKAEQADVEVITYEAGQGMRLFDEGTLRIWWEEISRSEQQVLLLSLETGGTGACEESMVWCSGAIWESELALQTMQKIRESAYVLVGEHGPVIKEPWPKEAVPSPDARLVCADREVLSWVVPSLPPSCGDDVHVGELAFRLPTGAGGIFVCRAPSGKAGDVWLCPTCRD